MNWHVGWMYLLCNEKPIGSRGGTPSGARAGGAIKELVVIFLIRLLEVMGKSQKSRRGPVYQRQNKNG